MFKKEKVKTQKIKRKKYVLNSVTIPLDKITRDHLIKDIEITGLKPTEIARQILRKHYNLA